MFKPFGQIVLNDKRQAVLSNQKITKVGLSTPLTGVSMAMALLFSSASVSAACKGEDCVCRPSQLQFATPNAVPNEDGQYPISLEADNLATQGDESVTLTGNAEVSQGRQTVVADKIEYFRDTERVVANGNIELISPNGDYISADSIDVVTSTSIGSLDNAKFKLAKGISSEAGIDTVDIDSRGSADKILLQGEGFVRLEDTTYTNCVEGNDSVLISAKTLELDRLAGVGTARNALVKFYGVPVFYSPYLSFPIDDQRKTGFLIPGFGSDEESGSVIELPWYWNIAPNQDATITPRFYTARGVQVAAEYRLRTQTSSTTVFGEILPDDDLFGDDRSLVSIQHSQQLTKNLTARLNYNDISDTSYFDDLSNDINQFSATFVPRDLKFTYTHDLFDVSARFNQLEIIDPDFTGEEPLERLPSINFNTRFARLDNGIKYGLTGSYTNFNSDTQVDGSRLVLSPYIEQAIESDWGYIKPALSLNYRAFDLNGLDSTLSDNSPSFLVPAVSIDSGLYFEKDINWFGGDALQTLEPRLFYAYAPDEDQDDVVLFDTSNVDFNNYENIFRVNRFFGQDRFADTNQVTLGLTSRVIDQNSGVELIKASVGQVYYLDDLEQSLDLTNNGVEQGFGDFLFELRTRGNSAWSTYSFIQYDHEEDDVRTARFDLAYEPKNNDRKRLSVGYYVSDIDDQENIDQVRLDLYWPISDRWQVSAEQRYSIEDSKNLFRDYGLEYNACCWKLRFSARNRVDNSRDDNERTSYFLELELTALGKIRSGL